MENIHTLLIGGPQMGKILVYVFNQMTDYEISFVCHILRTNAGKEVVTIGEGNYPIRTSSGFIITPEYTLSEIDITNVDGLILCGGYPPQDNREIVELIKQLDVQKKMLAAIGNAGTLFLAQSGILQNSHYTTPIKTWEGDYRILFGEKDPFPRSNHLKQRLVRSQHVITADGTAFLDFTVEVCSWLKLFKNHHEKHNFAKLLKQI